MQYLCTYCLLEEFEHGKSRQGDGTQYLRLIHEFVEFY